jgi:LPXTG-motif cell wall-anchored protein
MRNSILYIVGAVVLLGGGAFLFLKSKKTKDTAKLEELAELAKETIGGVTGVATTGTGTPTAPVTPTEKPISADDLLAVAKLKDAIISDIQKRNSYSKATSRANVQAQIDEKLQTLKGYGFGMDTNNQLIKIK